MRFLGAVGKNSYLAKTGADYIRGYVLGIAFYCSGRVLNGFMNIDGDLSRTIYSVVIKTIVNITGDFAVMMMHFLRKRRILHWKFKFSGIKEIFMNITDMLKKGPAQASSRIVKTIAGIEISHVLTLYASSAALAAYRVHVQ